MATVLGENPVGYSHEQETPNNVVDPTATNQGETSEYVFLSHGSIPSTQPLITI